MSGLTVVGVVVWFVLGLVGVLTGWRGLPAGATRARLVVALVGAVLGTGAVALFGAFGDGASGPLAWSAVGAGVLAAGALGLVVVRCVLALAAGSVSTPSRVRATVLRGGAWIGVLERLALLGTLLAGFPAGLVAVVAVKAFARYPELKTAQATGAIERFIIGTFASLGWAALCTGVVEVLLRGAS
ncbi:hypothetical protein GCM10022197_14250 [Microlunatus spumicola]|uniref:Integral membrane protein n=1 Tax=Microlunatus spumicola TaxID=81499 RepID=A0ABP6X1T4_9ACTN